MQSFCITQSCLATREPGAILRHLSYPPVFGLQKQHLADTSRAYLLYQHGRARPTLQSQDVSPLKDRSNLIYLANISSQIMRRCRQVLFHCQAMATATVWRMRSRTREHPYSKGNRADLRSATKDCSGGLLFSLGISLTMSSNRSLIRRIVPCRTQSHSREEDLNPNITVHLGSSFYRPRTNLPASEFSTSCHPPGK